MGDSSGGSSNIRNLKELIQNTKDNFSISNPDEKRWPCPFCSKICNTQIQCRVHIMREHPNIYNKNEEEFSQFIQSEDIPEILNINQSQYEFHSEHSIIINDANEDLKNQNSDNISETSTCKYCGKNDFKGQRGLSQHLRHCKKINNENNIQPDNNNEFMKVCHFCPKKTHPNLFRGERGLTIHIKRVHKDIANDLNNEISQQSIESLESTLAQLNKNVKILKRIPKAARPSAAFELSKLIDICVSKNDFKSWHDLLLFPYMAFQIPTRTSKSQSLSILVKKNIKNPQLPHLTNQKQNQASLSKRVEAKVADGDIRGAVKLLSSSDTLANNDINTYIKLQEKHPCPSRPLNLPEKPDEDFKSMNTTENDICPAILSFANGSAGGIDGIRPQHLKDLISVSNGDASKSILRSLTSLSNLMLSGKVLPGICKIIYGARLCALNKRDGGIRPIAVGSTYRRLTAKVACNGIREEIGAYLRSKQVGFNTRGGCEAAVHSTRTYIRNNIGTKKIILKIDLRNAFNSVERDEMLRKVKEKTPSIYPFVWQCYSASTTLFFGSEKIESLVGAQQGDPLGPMLFSLSIHPIIEMLASNLNIWYLDDGTLAGDPDVVLHDFQIIIHACKQIGLDVNTSKCELYFCGVQDQSIITGFENACPGIKITNDDLELLGAPLTEQSEERFILQKLESLKLMFERIKDLNFHTAYFLLKNCFAIPKLTYLLRTTACFKHKELLKNIDSTIKTTLESIINSNLTDEKWSIASMPIRCGGIGIRKSSDIALPAFLSSVHSTINLITSMLPNLTDETMVVGYDNALEVWSSSFQILPNEKFLQRNWDELVISHQIQSLKHQSISDKARYLASTKQESGGWLTVLPSKAIGTLLDNNTFRIAMALRFGNDICAEHRCICGELVLKNGSHGLSCPKCEGRQLRHSDLNNILHRSLKSADVPSRREPTGLFRDDGKRVDGMTLIPWSNGQLLVWDATCSDTLAPSYITSSSRKGGSVANLAANRKYSKYKKILDQNYLFVPFAVETLGPWCEEALNFIDHLGKEIINLTGERRSRLFLKQRISIAIQRGNAASVMGTFNDYSAMDEIFYIL